MQQKLFKLYNKNYKLLLIIPLLLLVSSCLYLGMFYNEKGDFIEKDVSLTGGTTITIFPNEEVNIDSIKESLLDKGYDILIRELTDFTTGKQKAIVIESASEVSNSSDIKSSIEEFLGYKLDNNNSSTEMTGSVLSNSFYQQLIYSIVLSFSLMSLVVLFLFGASTKIKLICTTITFIPLLMFFAHFADISGAIFLSTIALIINVIIYFNHSIPSAAVVISAFADLVMTLALVDFLGVRVSTAGIVAFLMLIGYSVDTDIMLTTRLLKRKDETTKSLWGAFKTGTTMTITSIVAIATAFLITQSLSPTLKQVFMILLIGLFFDLINTWITNASMLKWYLEKRGSDR